jgi:hypothetical protein
MCDVNYCIMCLPRHQYCPNWHQQKQATSSGRVDGGEADDNEDEEGLAPWYMHGSCGRPVEDIRGEDLIPEVSEFASCRVGSVNPGQAAGD